MRFLDVVAVGVLLGAFVGLAVLAHVAGSGTALDHAVLDAMIAQRRGAVTTAAIVVTDAGSPVAMVGLAALSAVVLWWRRRSPLPGLVLIGTLGAAWSVSTVTKVVVDASRPPRSMQLVTEVDPSFPSGHVTGTVALLGTLAVIVGVHRPRGMRIALAIAVSVGATAVALTRLYLGVHWLIDVVGGALLGATAVLLAALTLTAFRPPNTEDHSRQARERRPEARRRHG